MMPKQPPAWPPALLAGAALLAMVTACDRDATGPAARLAPAASVAYCLDDSVAAYRIDQPAYRYYVWNLPGTATAGRYPYRLVLASDGRMSGGGRYESLLTEVADWFGTGPDTTSSATTWFLPANGAGRWRSDSAGLHLTFDDPTLVYLGRKVTAVLFAGSPLTHITAPDSTGFVLTYLDRFTDVDGSTTSESVRWVWVICP